MASSCICTSPLAVFTVVELLDVVTVSNSAEFKSFLLIIVHRRSGVYNKFSFLCLRVDGEGRHQFSEGEKIAVLFFSFNFKICLASFHAAHGHIALAILSLPETDPQILEDWGYANEDHLGKSFQAMDFGLECLRDVTRL